MKTNDMNIECKAQDDCQPHPTESAIIIFFCAFIEQSDDNQSHQCKRNIPIDSPGKRGGCTEPGILGHHTQNNP